MWSSSSPLRYGPAKNLEPSGYQFSSSNCFDPALRSSAHSPSVSGNMLTADDLHSKSVPVERDRTVHVSHLNPDVREFVAHETDGPSHPQRIRDFPPNDGA